ncbi:MAG: Hsp70 family protein, partial [Burkholderiales bacterium]|nr:Hsp70 family protein [Burkholderiales bacterium]
TFDIDANGIMHVTAKDKATGKENKITIKANSGLTEDEIKRMVRDAEAHAEEDRKLHDLVNARNQADALVHTVKKSLTELGDKVAAEDKTKIEAAIKDVEEAIKSDDKEAIESKTQHLATVSQKIGEQAYAQSQGGPGPGPGASGGGDGGKKAESDVVDAEFEEVKEKKA